jgi:TatD DNase family protein
MIHYFDSHAHLSCEKVLPIANEMIIKAASSGIKRIINICTNSHELNEGLKLNYPGLYHAAATTPHDVDGDKDLSLDYFEEKIHSLIAIGETGLDYYNAKASALMQRKFLIRYLNLAVKFNKPIIFHCRNAFKDLFSIVDDYYPKSAKAILHCFTGTQEEADLVIEKGWYLSLSGIVTFKKCTDLQKVASTIPLDQLLIETDTPYLAPQSKRGIINEPSFVIETAECIAKIKNLPLEEIANKTWENSCKVFCLPN